MTNSDRLIQVTTVFTYLDARWRRPVPPSSLHQNAARRARYIIYCRAPSPVRSNYLHHSTTLSYQLGAPVCQGACARRDRPRFLAVEYVDLFSSPAWDWNLLLSICKFSGQPDHPWFSWGPTPWLGDAVEH